MGSSTLCTFLEYTEPFRFSRIYFHFFDSFNGLRWPQVGGGIGRKKAKGRKRSKALNPFGRGNTPARPLHQRMMGAIIFHERTALVLRMQCWLAVCCTEPNGFKTPTGERDGDAGQACDDVHELIHRVYERVSAF